MGTSMDTAAIFDARNTAYVAGYNEMFATKEMPGAYLVWTRVIKEQAKKVELGFLANVPAMRPWRGMRVAKHPRAYNQTIELDVHELTMDLPRLDVMYDRSGMFADFIQQVLASGKEAYNELMNALWVSASGAGPTGFDNVPVFSTSHPHAAGGGVNANLAASTALSFSTLNAALFAISAWTMENGRPFRSVMDTLEVSRWNETKAKELLGADRLITTNAAGVADPGSAVVAAGVKSNPLNGALRLVVNDLLNTTETRTYCTLINTSMANVRPMNLLEARFPEPVLENQMNSQRRILQDRYYVGLDGDFNGAGGAWPTAYRMKESA